MLKAVFRPNELVPVQEKIKLDTPTNYPDLAHLRQVETVAEPVDIVEEYRGPTADDLRREADMFRIGWAEEKERMIAASRSEAEEIIQDAQKQAYHEVKNKTEEAQIIKQQAEDEAERILADAKATAAEIENQIRQTLDDELKNSRTQGYDEGHEEGYAHGKAEVDRLIERTQVVLERAQDKRGEILAETEKEIIDLVLLISRKVVKIISENQRNVIVSNVIQALRKVKSKGNVIIRVNMADLKIATESKQDFIAQLESSQMIQVIEDTSVDSGGCIIETDFGEIDARISSQLAELENKILEISPIRSSEKIPPPVVRTASLNKDLMASSSLKGVADSVHGDNEITSLTNAALTASAAMAAIASIASKGKRESDQEMREDIGNFDKRSTD